MSIASSTQFRAPPIEVCPDFGRSRDVTAQSRAGGQQAVRDRWSTHLLVWVGGSQARFASTSPRRYGPRRVTPEFGHLLT